MANCECFTHNCSQWRYYKNYDEVMKLEMIQKWFGTVICFIFVYKNFLHENFATDQNNLIVQSTLETISF